MTPDEFAEQLGQLKGLMIAVREDQVRQADRIEDLAVSRANQMESVRSSLSGKIDGIDTKINKRVDDLDIRMRAVEIDSGKRGVQAGLASGGVAAVAVALAIKAGEMLLKLKGGG